MYHDRVLRVLSATPDTDAAAARTGLLMEEDLLDSPALTLGFFLFTTDFVFVLLNAVLWARSLVNG